MKPRADLSRPTTSQLSAGVVAWHLLLTAALLAVMPAVIRAEGLNHLAAPDALLFHQPDTKGTGRSALSLNNVESEETDGALNPIYPVLIPSEKQGMATLTYTHDGKVTTLQLIRIQGGSTGATAGCEHYRDGSPVADRNDRSELISCDGRIRGTLYRPDGTLRFEYDAKAGVHFVRRLKDSSQPRVGGSRRTKRNHLSAIQGPYQANSHSRYVELLLVVDNSLFRKLDSDLWQAYDYCSNLVNHINMLYNPLNIFIALTDVVVWRESDPIPVSQRAEETLNSFLAYRARTLLRDHPHHDHAQLLTAIEFNENVIGKAKVGGMCSDRSSGAIVRVHTDAVGVQASTLAHEMGHSFSMEHDEDADCSCPDRRCIMTRSVTGLTLQHWSNCSLEQLAVAFGRGLHHCLANRPTRLAVPSCGNGFVEPGEECDCGLEEACENHCCDATTCRLKGEAECATGECCDLATCRMREPASLCRAERGECDLPEYCTGRSEFCPTDVYRRDTEVCAGGEARCVAGRCRTRTNQCQALWGPSGHAASESCYGMNRQGTKYGNCGYEGRPAESYRKCATADMQCGLLFCHHHKQDEELELGEYNGDSRFSVQKGNETLRHVLCRSAYVDLGTGPSDGQHPAFVPDGAPCGDERMCYRQRCESIEQLNAWGLGGKLCGHNCYGRGVCNSEGHCHCEPGYDPPYCEHPGIGGSLDSGPASTGPGAVRNLLTIAALALLVSVLLFVLIVALTSRISSAPSSVGCTRWARRPWRLYKVRGTSPREPVTAQLHHQQHIGNGTIARRDISLPKYHSSTRDISDDQQYRPIGLLAPAPPIPPTAPDGYERRLLTVPRPIGHGVEPQLTVEYRIVPSAAPQWRPPVPIHRQRPL